MILSSYIFLGDFLYSPLDPPSLVGPRGLPRPNPRSDQSSRMASLNYQSVRKFQQKMDLFSGRQDFRYHEYETIFEICGNLFAMNFLGVLVWMGT